MPLRANVTRRANWTVQTLHLYEGTYLELHPEAGSGYWLVVDGRDPDKLLAGPFSKLNVAKRSAEALVARNSNLRKTPT